MESGSTAGAADLVEDCFKAAAARTFVAELSTEVIPTLESPATNLQADVLSLEVLVYQRSAMLAFSSLSFTGFLLSRAATLATLVSSAIKS
jgi:hypothetical protein